jgi:hypothetical protein
MCSLPKKLCQCCPHFYKESATFTIYHTVSSGANNRVLISLPERFDPNRRKETHLTKGKLRLKCTNIYVKPVPDTEPDATLGAMCFALKTNFPTFKEGIDSDGFKEIGHFSEQQLTKTYGSFGISDADTGPRYLRSLELHGTTYPKISYDDDGDDKQHGFGMNTFLERTDNLYVEIMPLRDGPFTPFKIHLDFEITRSSLKMQMLEDGSYSAESEGARAARKCGFSYFSM